MDKDSDSYISLFGQRVYLGVGQNDDDRSMLNLKHLSLKERADGSSISGLKLSPKIHSLPSEVLMIIFKLLSTTPQKHWPAEHFAHQRRTMGDIMKSPPIECNCEYNWLRPEFHWRLFPYAQARVCARWRAILSASPTLWTRIVVSRVPGDWTHPKELEDYLRWTKDLRIEVYIGKERNQRAESNGFGCDILSERDMIAQYTAILKPHLWRCTVIDYHLQYSTSLPSLVRDLSGIPECLESLKLVSDEESPSIPDSIDFENHPYSAPGNNQFLRNYPNLTTLALDGANFIVAALQVPKLIRCVQDDLTIHHYHYDRNVHPHVDTFGFTALHVLQAVFPRPSSDPELHQLLITFKSVEFTPIRHTRYICKTAQGSYSTYPALSPMYTTNNNVDDSDSDDDDDGDINWDGIYIKFVDMSDRLLSELTILGGASGLRIPQRVELQNCVIRAVDTMPALIKARTVQVPSSYTNANHDFLIPDCSFETIPFPYPRIGLSDVEDPSSVANFLDRIVGSPCVSIHSCAGLTDAVLMHVRDSLVDAHHCSLYGDEFRLGIGSLQIVGCANFTPGALWAAMSGKDDVIKGLCETQGAVRVPPGQMRVQHPKFTIDVDGTTSLEWERRFLQVSTNINWECVSRDSSVINNTGETSDEEMDDATEDPSNAHDIFDSFADLDLISPELDPVDDEALLAAIWPLTPRGDEVMGDARWVLDSEGNNHNASGTWANGSFKGSGASSLERAEKAPGGSIRVDGKTFLDELYTASDHDDLFLPQVLQGSEMDDGLFDDFVHPGYVHNEPISGDADFMNDLFSSQL